MLRVRGEGGAHLVNECGVSGWGYGKCQVRVENIVGC